VKKLIISLSVSIFIFIVLYFLIEEDIIHLKNSNIKDIIGKNIENEYVEKIDIATTSFGRFIDIENKKLDFILDNIDVTSLFKESQSKSEELKIYDFLNNNHYCKRVRIIDDRFKIVYSSSKSDVINSKLTGSLYENLSKWLANSKSNLMVDPIIENIIFFKKTKLNNGSFTALFYYTEDILDNVFKKISSLNYKGFLITKDKVVLINFPEIDLSEEKNLSQLVNKIKANDSGALRVQLNDYDKSIYYQRAKEPINDWFIGITTDTENLKISLIGIILLIIQAIVVLSVLIFIIISIKTKRLKSVIKKEVKKAGRIKEIDEEKEKIIPEWAASKRVNEEVVPLEDNPLETEEEIITETGVVSLSEVEEIPELEEIGEAEIALDVEYKVDAEKETSEESKQLPGDARKKIILEVKNEKPEIEKETSSKVLPLELDENKESSKILPLELDENKESSKILPLELDENKESTGENKKIDYNNIKEAMSEENKVEARDAGSKSNLEEPIIDDIQEIIGKKTDYNKSLPQLEKLAEANNYIEGNYSITEEDMQNINTYEDYDEFEKDFEIKEQEYNVPTIPDEIYKEKEDEQLDDELSYLINKVEGKEINKSNMVKYYNNLDNIFKQFIDELKVSRGAILFKDKDNLFKPVVLSGLNDETKKKLIFNGTEKIFTNILKRGKILFIKDNVFLNNEVKNKFSSYDSNKIKEIFFIPFEKNNEIFGIINVCLDTGGIEGSYLLRKVRKLKGKIERFI